ncbi:hypothetical protein TRAPUB_6621 [Trametes pubescens]|uniref:Cupin 2 conserved barrel domain-containing protein n=1 Tax=Trametes pubescens TaxID=154538 RepID=A0A1M2V577_TRAPU|nr:hypothetical protein TRAPUB_6621 [Trametes pubescens]
MSTTRPEYLVRTTEVPFESLRHLMHPMDNTNQRYTVSLGDSVGLTKLGIHFCRLPPGATSSTLHYHTNDDEFYYIIDAGGDDAVLLVWERPAAEGDNGDKGQGAVQEKKVPREENIKTGDFLGFKGGDKGAHAHALRAGAKEVVYIVGGSRLPMDNSVYPLLGRRVLTDRSQGGLLTWSVEEENLTPVHIPPPTVV